MAAIRDSLNTSASCTLPEVPLHWQCSWGLEHIGSAGQRAAGAQRAAGTQRAAGAQRAAGFSPRGPSAGVTAGAQSRDREGAVPGIHGAGGIGGLLAVEAPQAEGDPLRHWYFYDGNGNVGQLLAYDATGPTVNAAPAAKYEYDPYGQLINWTETIANPFRFSTKWFDTNTGLGYWGYRHYSPRLGRWLSRDPIEERGGKHLYQFCLNAATMATDLHGLQVGCDYLCTMQYRHPPKEPGGSVDCIVLGFCGCVRDGGGAGMIGAAVCAGYCVMCVATAGQNSVACDNCAMCAGVDFDCYAKVVADCVGQEIDHIFGRE